MESEIIEQLRYKRNEREKQRKIKLATVRGTLIVTSSIVLRLISGNVQPADVRYYFTSDDVSVEQSDDNYRSKVYIVKNSDGTVDRFSFDTLESIEPDVHGGYTYIPEEYVSNGGRIGIQREEINPVKNVLNGSSLVGFLSGSIMMGYGLSEKNKMNRENERRR